MMRKIVLTAAVAAGVLFVACKKDRTCSCTVYRTGTTTTEGKVSQELFGIPFDLADTSFTQPINDVRIYDKKMTKITKADAKGNCINYSQPFFEKNLTSVPAASFNLVVTVTNSGDEKYECKLK